MYLDNNVGVVVQWNCQRLLRFPHLVAQLHGFLPRSLEEVLYVHQITAFAFALVRDGHLTTASAFPLIQY